MPLSKIVANSITDNTITTDQIADTSVHGRRNLLINGGMTISQRATATTTVSGAGVYNTIDRLKLWNSSDGAFTSEQSTVVPSGQGFNNSVKFQVTTADSSIAASQYATFGQIIEAQDCQRLSFGTSAAKTSTVSFWVRSNKTGVYCIAFDKEDSPSTSFVKEFTISSADTWEKKEIVVTPDSQIKGSDGAIANDNGRGIRVFIGLAWGTDYHRADGTWGTGAGRFATSNQVNWLDSTSNNFYLTGFQVEVGDKATPFEHRSFADELNRCLRYYHTNNIGDPDGSLNGGASGIAFDAAEAAVCYEFPVPMRATPTVTLRDNAGNTARVHRMRAGDHGNSASASLLNKTGFANFASSGMTTSMGYLAGVEADAEL